MVITSPGCSRSCLSYVVAGVAYPRAHTHSDKIRMVCTVPISSSSKLRPSVPSLNGQIRIGIRIAIGMVAINLRSVCVLFRYDYRKLCVVCIWYPAHCLHRNKRLGVVQCQIACLPIAMSNSPPSQCAGSCTSCVNVTYEIHSWNHCTASCNCQRSHMC